MATEAGTVGQRIPELAGDRFRTPVIAFIAAHAWGANQLAQQREGLRLQPRHLGVEGGMQACDGC